ENEGERDFDNDECVTDARTLTVSNRTARVGFERTVQVDACRLKCGRESKNNSGRKRNPEGENKNSGVELNAGGTGNFFRHERDQRLRTPDREEQTKRTTDRGKEQALREQLPDDTATSGPDRQPHGHFAGARRSPGEQQ